MRKEKIDNILEWIGLACACAAFAPIVYFLGATLAESAQLRDAVVILFSILIALAVRNSIRPHRPRLTRRSLLYFLASYILTVFANALLRPNFDIFAQVFNADAICLAYALSVLCAFSAFVAAVGFVFFDTKRYVYAFSGGIAAFSVFSVFWQFADLPLRIWAGRAAGYVLSTFCDSVALMFYKGELPQIVLRAGGKSYLVATECNGFGIISSCLVLSVVLAIFVRGVPVWRRFARMAAAFAIGFLANTLRIVSIIATSLAVGDKHYYFFHEALGYFFFGAALVSITLLCTRNTLPAPNRSAPNSDNTP